MSKSAVPTYPGHKSQVRRPSWTQMLKASSPRDFRQVPTIFLGVALILFVCGSQLRVARVHGATFLLSTAAVFVAAVLLFYATAWFLVKLKWIDKSRVEQIAVPKLSGRESPPHEPIADTKLDPSYVPTVRFDARQVFDLGAEVEEVEEAVQKNVAQAVARRTGGKIVFDGSTSRRRSRSEP